MVFKMYDESDLLEDYDVLCWKTEDLALKSILNIELPLCSILSKLSSTNCLNLMKINIDNWSNENQPTLEKILLLYVITDYINCGLSSPNFHAVFNNSIQSEKSKTKFLKSVIFIWNRLFINYKLTSLNIEFVKCLLVSLDRLFMNISNTVPEDINIKNRFNKVIDIIKSNINKFECIKDDSQIPYTLSSNVEFQNTNKNKEVVIDIENIVPKQSVKLEFNSIKKSENEHIKQCKQNIENMKCITLNDHQQKESLNNIPLIDHHLSKKQKLMSNIYNVPNLNGESDPKTITQPQEQKLNAFQIMMLNAKKHKYTK